MEVQLCNLTCAEVTPDSLARINSDSWRNTCFTGFFTFNMTFMEFSNTLLAGVLYITELWCLAPKYYRGISAFALALVTLDKFIGYARYLLGLANHSVCSLSKAFTVLGLVLIIS